MGYVQIVYFLFNINYKVNNQHKNKKFCTARRWILTRSPHCDRTELWSFALQEDGSWPDHLTVTGQNYEVLHCKKMDLDQIASLWQDRTMKFCTARRWILTRSPHCDRTELWSFALQEDGSWPDRLTVTGQNYEVLHCKKMDLDQIASLWQDRTMKFCTARRWILTRSPHCDRTELWSFALQEDGSWPDRLTVTGQNYEVLHCKKMDLDQITSLWQDRTMKFCTARRWILTRSPHCDRTELWSFALQEDGSWPDHLTVTGQNYEVLHCKKMDLDQITSLWQDRTMKLNTARSANIGAGEVIT